MTGEWKRRLGSLLSLGRLLRWRRVRVPVVFQMDATECAAACLTMILRYYGFPVGLGECRSQLGAGRDGASAGSVVRVARGYGLRVRGFSVGLGDFGKVTLPAIAFWGFNHFVVIERWSPSHVDLVDPAHGRRRVDRREFGAQFTGVLLTFEPGVAYHRAKSPDQRWRSYLRYLLAIPHLKRLVAQLFVASLALPVLGLAMPLLTKVVVDWIIPQRLKSVTWIVGAAIVVVVATQVVATYLRSILLVHMRARFDSRLMVGLQEHLLQLPLRFFQQRTTGDLLMRIGSGASLREMLTNDSLALLLDGTLVVAYLVLLLAYAPQFALLTCTIALLQVLLLVVTFRPVHNLMQQQLVAQASTQTFGVQMLEGMATMKAAGLEGLALEYWSNLYYKELNVGLRREHLSAMVNSALTALRAFAPLGLLWFGARLVLDGRLPLGSMLAYSAIAVAFLTPLASLVSTGQRLQLSGAHLQRLSDVIEAEPEEQGAPGLHPSHTVSGHIELRGVSFRYSPSSPPVLSDIDLVVRPGQKVALVGRSGSGKSTLALVLLGLYPPTEGDILYDDVSLRELDKRAVRGQFGVVLQHPFLFGATVRDNIALNNPAIPMSRIVEACRIAVMDEDIEAMPMKYDTWVGEAGGGLSGGQRQRLALARALVHSPRILLLDEATSHLDVTTEAELERRLSELSCTRIVIAHRLSTVRSADLVVVLSEGRIVERGTHEELLARDAHYAALVRSDLGVASIDSLAGVPELS